MDAHTKPFWPKSALIIIDMQKDFVLPGGTAEIKGSYEVVDNIRKIADHFRAKGRPVIHVIRLYKSDGSNAERCRKQALVDGKKIVIAGSEGAEPVDELKPDPHLNLEPEQLLDGAFQQAGPEEWILYKPRWGAFYNTGLEDVLRLKRIDTLLFCGCNFPNCPRTSIYEASERDFRVAFASDATSGIYQQGIEELTNIGTAVMPTEALINEAK